MRTRTETRGGAKRVRSKQDTPGRPKPSSSRQQTQPGQGTLTGSPKIDAASARSTRKKTPSNEPTEKSDPRYRDRPTDDGKHGDGKQEPNSGFPSKSE